jgi:hypothetical protein
MKKIFDFSTNSQFDASFEQLQNNADFQRLNEKFKIKPFYLKYKGLKTFLNGFSYFIQLITVVVSFVCVVALLAPMMNIYFAYLIATLSLSGIELLKRLTFKPTVKEFLQFQKVAVFGLILSLTALCASLWLTWNGGKETVFLLSDRPELLNVDSLTGYEKTRIKDLTAQLSEVKKTQSWKGVLTPKGQTSYNRITAQISKLDDKLGDKEKNLSDKNEATATAHTTATTEKATNFRFITVVLDILLFVLLAWLEFYDYRSFVEFAKLKNETINDTLNLNDVRIDDNRIDDVRNNDNRTNEEKKIPFSENESRTVIKGFRRYNDDDDEPTSQIKAPQLKVIGCVHCKKDFEKKAPKHVFCSDSCRVASWENKTGKKLKKAKAV